MEKQNYRIGLMFHETFKLARKPISEILNLAKHFETTGELKLKPIDIKNNTLLGNNYIKAFLPYSKGVGFTNFNNNLLTSIGKKAVAFDPLLQDNKTLWLMHYHLCSSLGPGPVFWNLLIKNLFYPGRQFSRFDIKEIIAQHYFDNNEKLLSEKSLSSTTSIFLNSYIETEGLGGLSLISQITDDYFSVNKPVFNYIWVLAYALCHYWENMYPGNKSVSLERLFDSELPKYFLLSKEDFEHLLNELKADGFIDIHRTAQPYQVFLKYGIDYAINKIYENE